MAGGGKRWKSVEVMIVDKGRKLVVIIVGI
jgi:hypothetical protein